MRYVRIWRVLALTLALALLWIGQDGPAHAQGRKVLVIAIGADQTGLDPLLGGNNESGFIQSTIFDGLVMFKPGSSQIGPGLAESWAVSPDGLVYTFRLRRGVKFHDGTPMNARTVAEDIDRAINPRNPCFVLARRSVNTYIAATYGTVQAGSAAKVDALDDYTLQFTLATPNAVFLTNLAMRQLGIVSSAATKKYDCDPSQNPVGTGPFRFVEAVRNDHVTVEANPDYWGGRPKIDRIIFRVVPESSTRLLMLQRNEVQILADVPPSDSERIRTTPGLKLVAQPGLTVMGVVMSADAGPFRDARVRRALNYAVDKDTINKTLYGGATTASQIMPPVSWGHNSTIKPYPYDPPKAKALLADAGYPNGFATELSVFAEPRGWNPIGGAKIGEAVQAYLAKVGIDAKIVQYEFGAYYQRLRFTPWEGMAIVGWSGDNGDPDNFITPLFGWDDATNKPRPTNYGRLYNATLVQLIREGRETSIQARRVQVYKQANQIIHDDAPWIFVNHVNQVRATRANVKGFLLNPTQMFFHMELVSLE